MQRVPGLFAAVLLVAGCTATGPDGGPGAAALSAAPTGAPRLEVQVVADGLDHPWDVAEAPDGTLLVDERAGGLTAVLPDGTVQEVRADFGDLFARGETGLMGLTLDPGFAGSRRFYTCQGVTSGGSSSIAVIAWTMAPDWSAATRVADPLVGGIPVNEQSGRHGGCRLRFAADGALLIGTGDSTVGTFPQDPGSFGGKVLRADAATGEVAVWTSGHRNVQGLAVRPGSGQVFAVEHGPDRDDEVNLQQPGGNYGWDPEGSGGSYDQSVPMTDPAIPGAIPAVWTSGEPTLATSGATFLDGDQWGAYDGLLVVALLKAQGVLALRLDADGALQQQFHLPELEGSHGRIRSVLQGTDGALYLTTDNGDGADTLLRVTPR
ncbi:MAG TPA: PQQ-dependent sugar dehydrogenase [Blastococcus sp.]